MVGGRWEEGRFNMLGIMRMLSLTWYDILTTQDVERIKISVYDWINYRGVSRTFLHCQHCVMGGTWLKIKQNFHT